MKNKPFLGKIGEYQEVLTPQSEEQERNWLIALGLQEIDGKNIPSDILMILKELNINGKMTNEEVLCQLKKYYQKIKGVQQIQKECDMVSARIVELIGDESFSFTPIIIKNIHHFLFQDIYSFNGSYRTKNIVSNENILNGDHVVFTPCYEIEATLAYEFDMESNFSYAGLTVDQKIKHFATFISNVWQIHPFMEGNTRTIAVFTQKYLRYLGFDVNNDIFKEHALYFRNALVRSQYSNVRKGIYQTDDGLIKFFENLMLGKKNVLDNDDLIPNSIYEEVYNKAYKKK